MNTGALTTETATFQSDSKALMLCKQIIDNLQLGIGSILVKGWRGWPACSWLSGWRLSRCFWGEALVLPFLAGCFADAGLLLTSPKPFSKSSAEGFEHDSASQNPKPCLQLASMHVSWSSDFCQKFFCLFGQECVPHQTQFLGVWGWLQKLSRHDPRLLSLRHCYKHKT